MSERVFSFEFFPPATPEGVVKLRATRDQLAQLKPAFFSVTFGAGGSTRDRTLETVTEIQQQGLPAAPHISCIASTHESILSLLDAYRTLGTRRLVALRGRIDLPAQLRQPGIELPIACVFEEYTADILENRYLKCAVRRLLRVPQCRTRRLRGR